MKKRPLLFLFMNSPMMMTVPTTTPICAWVCVFAANVPFINYPHFLFVCQTSPQRLRRRTRYATHTVHSTAFDNKRRRFQFKERKKLLCMVKTWSHSDKCVEWKKSWWWNENNLRVCGPDQAARSKQRPGECSRAHSIEYTITHEWIWCPVILDVEESNRNIDAYGVTCKLFTHSHTAQFIYVM